LWGGVGLFCLRPLRGGCGGVVNKKRSVWGGGGGGRLFADFRFSGGGSWNLTSAKTKNECIWIVGDLYEQQQ